MIIKPIKCVSVKKKEKVSKVEAETFELLTFLFSSVFICTLCSASPHLQFRHIFLQQTTTDRQPFINMRVLHIQTARRSTCRPVGQFGNIKTCERNHLGLPLRVHVASYVHNYSWREIFRRRVRQRSLHHWASARFLTC